MASGATTGAARSGENDARCEVAATCPQLLLRVATPTTAISAFGLTVGSDNAVAERMSSPARDDRRIDGGVIGSLARVHLVGEVTTARLLGRAPVEEDLSDYVRFWTDSRIPEEVWPSDIRTTGDAGRVLRATIGHWEQWGFGPWTVVQRDTGAVVGRVGLAHARVAGESEIEVAWFLSGDVWGRGYATEMAREAVRVAFELLGLENLVSFTTPANVASQAVMRKLGFRYENDVEHAGLPQVLFRLRAGDTASG